MLEVQAPVSLEKNNSSTWNVKVNGIFFPLSLLKEFFIAHISIEPADERIPNLSPLTQTSLTNTLICHRSCLFTFTF